MIFTNDFVEKKLKTDDQIWKETLSYLEGWNNSIFPSIFISALNKIVRSMSIFSFTNFTYIMYQYVAPKQV